jgi:SPP1 family predicted phage head-tail adaptor
MDRVIIANTGNMRHQVVLRHGIRVSDGMGGHTFDPGGVYQTVWAEVKDVTGGYDKAVMDQVETQYKKKITIYYDSTITPDMLIDYNGYRYHITNMKRLGEIDFFWEIEAEAAERDKI